MIMSRTLIAAAFAAITAVMPAAAATISNTATGGSIGNFGFPDSQTYGQVFVAPVTGTLDSFTLHLNGGVGDIVGAVGSWNGTAAHDFGFGSPATLVTSSPFPSGTGGAQSFSGLNVSVTAGNTYVAFLTVFGLFDTGLQTSMPLGDALPGGGYFVWNNTSDPFGNTSWNYFANFGNVLFEANFTPTAVIPVPAALPLMLLALGGLGIAARRRRG